MSAKIKKLLALILAAVMLLAMCVSCSKKDDKADDTAGVADTAAADNSSSEKTDSSAPATGAAAAVEKMDENVIESVQSDVMVDKITLAVPFPTFDPGPFGAPGGHFQTHVLTTASLMYQPYLGAPLEDCQNYIAKNVEYDGDKTVKVEIYDYVKDNQGNEITAEDVAWSLLYIRDEASINMGHAYAVALIDDITVTGDYTFEITTKGKPALGQIENVMCKCEIFDKEWFESTDEGERVSNPACTGAYYITDFVSGSGITMEAVPDFWQQDKSLRPYAAYQNVKTVRLNVIPDVAMRIIALEGGEIDGSPVDAANIGKFLNEDGTAIDGFNVLSYLGGTARVLMFNCDDGSTSGIEGMFNNQQLRQALCTAFDNDELAAAFSKLPGTYVVNADPTSPDNCDYLEKWNDEKWYEFDLDEAKRLYAESGAEEGLSCRMLLSNDTTNVAGCSALQAFWMELGIDTQLMAYDAALFNTYKFNSAEWDVIVDDKNTGSGISASSWNDVFNPAAYENGSACFTHDDKLVELLTAAISVHDDASVDAFHQYLMEQCYEYPLFLNNSFFVTQDGVQTKINTVEQTLAINEFSFADDYKSVTD